MTDLEAKIPRPRRSHNHLAVPAVTQPFGRDPGDGVDVPGGDGAVDEQPGREAARSVLGLDDE